jgi:putative ABC transport system permease protein
VDPNQPVAGVATMERVRERSLASKRFTMLVLGVFAALALVIAAMGIYGLMAYVVSLRRREIGVRMALGATRLDVLGSVLRHVLTLTAAGLVIGAIATLFTQRLLAGLLYGVHPFDPVVLLTVASGLFLASVTGGLGPAVRAASTPAMVVLRSE